MAKKRKDINSLTATELKDYVHALNILRERSVQNPDDETGYGFQAALHNDVFVGPCEHGNDLFLPWHRAHLHYFEKLLQETEPPRTSNVTVPYWDWLHPQSRGKFPAAFDKPGLSMPDRNNRASDLPPDTLQIVIGETNWNRFGGFPTGSPLGDYGQLELGPHNDMHGNFIGGKMGDPGSAAEDPIYFSFHAFIDLLWAEWQRRNNMPQPTSPESDLRGFTNQPLHKVKDFQVTTALDYEYEYNDNLKRAFESTVNVPEFSNLLLSKKVRPMFEGKLALQLEESGSAQFSIPEPLNTIAQIRLTNLKIPHSGSYKLEAYVHPKDVAFKKDDPDFVAKYGVGYVALWKSHDHFAGHGHHHGHHGHHLPMPHHPVSCTPSFNIQKVIQRLAPNEISNLMFTLYYIPAPGPQGQPLPGAGVVKEVLLDEVILENYLQ